MSIQPLGKEVALLLRASALVVSPVSLVKELVDNAIDAKSTTIKVQITRNGVDQIEVQDNGVGIHADDFDALGRRAHTSKLRAFQDLPRVGGTSLGFRGEALAAANSFAEVTITTRTAQEKVGHRVCLEPKEGGVRKRDPVPAPVGTTVRIQHLFASIPVRKRMAVEDFQKSTVGIKHLLTTYALAKPHIRISFCVLGDSRSSWSYSPVGPPTVREAAFQVFGNGLAPQCVGITLVETASSPHDKLVEELTEHEISRITVDAFLPKQDADISALCGKGAFVSVDGRPVAPGRGIIKKIVSTFKARLDSFYRRRGAQPGLSNVFIQLDIRCPPGLYDINVSPAKDEVMFTDESRVLKVIDELFDVSYALAEPERGLGGNNAGEFDGLTPEDLQALESFAIGDDNSSWLDPPNSSLNNFERDPEVVPYRNDQLGCPPDEGIASSIDSNDDNVKPDTAWLIDMSAPCDDDEVPQGAVTSVIDQLRNTAARRVQKQNDEADVWDVGGGGNPLAHGMRSEAPGAKSRLPGPFTPVANAPNPWTIATKSAKAKQPRDFSEDTDGEPAFDSGSNQMAAPDSQLSRSKARFPISPSPDTRQNGAAIMCTPPRTLASPQVWTLQTPPPSDTRKSLHQRNLLPRFKPPTMSATRGRQLEASRPHERLRQGQRHMASLHQEISEPLYSKHQAENRRSWDSCMGPANLVPLRYPNSPGLPDPFMSPPLVSVADVTTDVPALGGISPAPTLRTNDLGALEDGRRSIMDGGITDEFPNQHDPRKYLMKQRRSMSRDRRAGRVLRRVKSALLPLETIPVGLEMYTASLDVSTSRADIHSTVFSLIHIDSYVSMGTSQTGLPDDLEEATDAQNRVQRVFGEWSLKTTGTWYDLKLNLRSQVKGKSSY